MKKLLTFGLCSFVLTPCFATEIKPFIGANLALSTISWTNEAIKAGADLWDLPISTFGMGVDGGVKFANDTIYNCGITLAYDYTFDTKATIHSNAKPYIQSLTFGLSSFSATFDNYIRISGEEEHRQDIVLGLGIASMTERVKLTPTSFGIYEGLTPINETGSGGATVLKIGYNENFGKFDIYTNLRFFFPGDNEDEKDIQTILQFNFGARYIF